ncbi:MAG: flagellar hook-length control protein FliK, partial [Rhizobacter sp.]
LAEAARADTAAATPDPTLAARLANAPAPAVATPAPTPDGAAAEVAEPRDDKRLSAAASRPDGTLPERDVQGGGNAGEGRHRADAAAIQGDFAAALGQQERTIPGESTGERRSGDAQSMGIGATAGLGAAGRLAAPAAPEGARPPVVVVPTPLAAPEFAQGFGVEVSLLARDGVQQAELHLNPAEMGPVSVHIVLDGSQARVDFGADVAATRRVIEAGLPELAGALRDAGLTLAGGGVSEHSRGRQEAQHQRPGPAAIGNGSDRSGEDRVVEPVRRRVVAAGGVDLYA